ncbi:MAG: TIGR04053 family radical SAM/SPASM domain-containing protein [Armatimonadota bacterium]|nr:TIGR04053 family radical SAM/SPASM domain-containing protein [Armatimonadota bacterium]MDR7386349.1 TIGR04053 family radical SAM/SPASM domain-containing protein [Armatimonadota bacterium]MDR7388184.1 TIGR04053 family radical SAM/SPASM domain-containing protein [Armatimonadota bacterium]MDR7390811.1 TIGR04053 family radical SAM/SPASM domain-containing protein [Armatimonadota bacterium]MDR7392978.1 TIGR04053 family radical SAM/SPASM domain-containing protein [Armatimonadota bacterium]
MNRPVATSPAGLGQRRRYVFDRAPLLIYWELTRACDLACQHCRAEAVRDRHPLELSTEEGRRMLRGATAFGDPLPHWVLTGGDPFKRPDLPLLVEEARGLGFGVSLAPSATPLVTREAVRSLARAGVQAISLSLDGATAERHDGLRGIPGCFDLTLRLARYVREEGVALQVNTLVTAATVDDLPALYQLVRRLDVIRWSLFFLIRVGRGRMLEEVSPEVAERLCHWLFDLSRESCFAIKTTEAPHYRRVALLRMLREGMTLPEIARTSVGRGFGVRDGNGIVFVSHVGEVYPSGFLPLRAGSVRERSLVEVYRSSEVMVRLRDTDRLRGKCGRCPFREICGGSRARAYAHTGDPMGSDPLCPYEPLETAAAPGGP